MKCLKKHYNYIRDYTFINHDLEHILILYLPACFNYFIYVFIYYFMNVA